MGWELFVAWRHLSSKYATGFISLISLFSIVGIAIGVAALIIVLSVMNGFEDVVRTRIIGMDAHIRLRAFHNDGVTNPGAVMEQLEVIDAITGMSPHGRAVPNEVSGTLAPSPTISEVERSSASRSATFAHAGWSATGR